MKLSLQREDLLKPLQLMSGVVEKKQTLPILSNVLLSIDEQHLHLTGTDLEVQLEYIINLSEPTDEKGAVTVPGRKLTDICRSLPEGAQLDLHTENDKMIVHSGRSRFVLATLPANDFPKTETQNSAMTLNVPQKDLRFLTQRTHFAMAQQDVRYYLNGMLFEVADGSIRAIATDGHRLALNAVNAQPIDANMLQLIIPHKGITELMRLLDDTDTEVKVGMSSNSLHVSGPNFTFISKLMDGNYPDYDRVVPKEGNKTVLVDKELLKQALTRAAILSNEKFRGVSLQLQNGVMRISANNPEQEEAEEEINVEYEGEPLSIGFNVNYLIDILNTVTPGKIKITLSTPNNSVLIEEAEGDGNSFFVVMPMRL